MSSFVLNIQGQLNSMHLSDSNALWPMYETIVNSIQAISESTNKDSGEINIFAHRVELGQTRLEKNDILDPIESFSITDNGVGFNSGNYESFNTAYSTYKLKMGCKGIGRFLWLLAFEDVKVESTFEENGKWYKRQFLFTANGITPEDACIETEERCLKTTVHLNQFKIRYREKCPVGLDILAKKIIEHCLPFFFFSDCPIITLSDGISDSINLNNYYKVNIEPSLHQDHFQVNGKNFILYHIKMPEGAIRHELHFCANLQEVITVELNNYIPELHKKIISLDEPLGFYYLGYLTSSYLDSIVTTTRTNFEFDESNGQAALSGTGKDEIVNACIEFIKGYLSDYISEIKKKKRELIDAFVSNSRPQYRYLLGKKPEIYDEIPAGLSPEKLELELHKKVQSWELEIKEEGQKLEKEIKKDTSKDQAVFDAAFEKYCSSISEISRTSLAEYVVRRKVLLDILDQTLTIQDDGKFKKEDRIHMIICPMRHTSDDIAFEEMNLWIIDERLAYHRYLASDKTLKSIPLMDSNSTKEPDIAVFNQAFAFSDDDEPLNSITIVEFKKPDNDKDNPIDQVGEYIDQIREGFKKRADGLSFSVPSSTYFNCFIVCNLTSKMKTKCRNAGFQPTPDNAGFYGYHAARNAFYQIISYPKLLSDANKRNQILFDKLFSPKLNEIVHFPNDK